MNAVLRSFPHFSPIPISGEMTLSEAAEVYLQLRTSGGQARYIKKTTEHSYRQYVASLKLFFGDTKLKDITWLPMKEYAAARVAGAPPFIRRRRPFEEPGPCPAKPAKANQELQLLRLLKMRAQCWTPTDAMYYERLQEPESDLPRALTQQEERHWLSVSMSQQRWMVVHWYSMLAFHTCLSTNEIRALRIGDINLASGILTVPFEGSKNRYRQRTVPLDPDAAFAAEQLIARARTLGSVENGDYLFPFRDIRANRYIPSRPMTVHGIRALWEEVRAASGLKSFRPYDTRHTAITRQMEAGPIHERHHVRRGPCKRKNDAPLYSHLTTGQDPGFPRVSGFPILRPSKAAIGPTRNGPSGCARTPPADLRPVVHHKHHQVR